MFISLLARASEARATDLERERGAEAGFTLIELMVVLLIIAILLAIAIPTFLGVSGAARDRSAQSNLTNAVTEAISSYQNAQTYDASSGQASAALNTACSQNIGASGCSGTVPAVLEATSSVLASGEASFSWGAAACTVSTAARCVSVQPVDANYVGDGQGIILATMSGSGTCWYALDLEATPTAAAGEASTTGFAAGQSSLPVSTAGTYYATESGSSVTCSAAHAQGFANWYSSYSSSRSE
jgi:type IV pilus assembly protein PilA